MNEKGGRFPGTFWIANTMEIFERMAWYGFFAVSSLYITGPKSEGALGFTSEQRGTLQGVVTAILYLLPVFTGALADRYGYKKTFFVAFSILTPAYYLLGRFTSYGGFFAVFLLVALGAAAFKPVIVGTIARTTDEKNSRIGFGIFYMMVNIGGFVGPIIAGIVRGFSWSYVFAASSCWIACNFFWLLVFYKEPTTEARSGKARSLGRVLADSLLVLSNWRFMLFLVILSGFWTVFNQIFMTLPEYIRDFTDTTPVLATLRDACSLLGIGAGAAWFQGLIAKGYQINPEYLVNIDAGAIIALQLAVSAGTARIGRFATMVGGVFLAAAGMAVFLISGNGWVVIAGIVLFAVGEMAASPTSQEYIGRIAPPDKVALFMGYYFVAIALGNLFGGLLSGFAYGTLARDMKRPDLMWLLFVGLGVLTALLLMLYNKFVVQPKNRPAGA